MVTFCYYFFPATTPQPAIEDLEIYTQLWQLQVVATGYTITLESFEFSQPVAFRVWKEQKSNIGRPSTSKSHTKNG